MASQADAPSARAAAAEVRRRRLLARGGERLSSITVGIKARQDASDAGAASSSGMGQAGALAPLTTAAVPQAEAGRPAPLEKSKGKDAGCLSESLSATQPAPLLETAAEAAGAGQPAPGPQAQDSTALAHERPAALPEAISRHTADHVPHGMPLKGPSESAAPAPGGAEAPGCRPSGQSVQARDGAAAPPASAAPASGHPFGSQTAHYGGGYGAARTRPARPRAEVWAASYEPLRASAAAGARRPSAHPRHALPAALRVSAALRVALAALAAACWARPPDPSHPGRSPGAPPCGLVPTLGLPPLPAMLLWQAALVAAAVAWLHLRPSVWARLEEQCSSTSGFEAFLGPKGAGLLIRAAPKLADLAASAASLGAAAGAAADAVAIYLLTAVLLGELGLPRVWGPLGAWQAACSTEGA